MPQWLWTCLLGVEDFTLQFAFFITMYISLMIRKCLAVSFLL